MTKKISKRSKAKKDKTGKKAATKKRSKKTAAKRSSAKKTAAKRTAAPSKISNRVSKTPTKKANPKPEGKTVWKISPEKHGHTNVWVFKKDGLAIKVSQTYRFTSIIVAQNPDLTKYDPKNGIKFDEFDYCELGDDSWAPDWTFPDELPIEYQKRIERLWDEKHLDGMIEEGWSCDDGTYFYGPLSVEEVEAEYPHNPV
jgi:hypothetical protein